MKGIFQSLFLTTLTISLSNFNTSWAGPFKISNREFSDSFSVIEDDLNALFNTMEVEVNSSLPDADQNTYLKGTAHAAVLTTKGLGVDYANRPQLFIVGAGVGVGASVGDQSLSDIMNGNIKGNQVKGFGVTTSAMVGLNMGMFPLPKLDWFDPDKLMVFVNYLSMEPPGMGAELKGNISSFGLHFQYKFMDEVNLGYGLLKWGGLDFTTGIDMAALDLTFTETYTVSQRKNVTVSNIPLTVLGTFNGTVIAGADVNVKTIPIEISTNFRLMYFLSMFGGLGADLNFGEAKSKANVTGNVEIIEEGSKQDAASAIASIDLGQSGSPSSMTTRWFIGSQLNLTVVKVYAQLNSMIGEDAYGVNAGVRIAW